MKLEILFTNKNYTKIRINYFNYNRIMKQFEYQDELNYNKKIIKINHEKIKEIKLDNKIIYKYYGIENPINKPYEYIIKEL